MWSIRALIIFSSMFLAWQSFAQIPPLSQELREEYSSNIISGIVVSMQKKLVETSPYMKDYVYEVTLATTEITKGDDRRPKISFTFWKAAERPDSWCGPGGQYGMFKLYDEIRVYLAKDGSGSYNLIMPNGFDKI